ncbi:MAG: hypothetical protein AAGG01_06775 [Planctomycetota bacterium]
MKLIALCLAALPALISCISTQSVPLGTNRYAPPPKTVSMPVYEQIEDIPGYAEKIGIVTSRADVAVGWPRVVRNLKREARRMGANALVLHHAEGGEGLTDYRFSIFSMPFAVKTNSALAIRIHDMPEAISLSSELGSQASVDPAIEALPPRSES